ncbi:MAG: penicillin acylase family protein [Myxococcales bacterium]|nr:MAG: penicillin acylase family protein [Myxococcales bacterium]
MTTPRARWTRDEHGIPQITADDIDGLYWGMGYCHAMDRGLQMLIMRILGQGRAAELLDGGDEMVEVDRFFRRMNWSEGVDEEAAKLDPDARVACQAYCDGVNARFAKSTPWELKLVAVRPELWTIRDTLLLARMTGFLTLAQSQGEVERLFVEMVKAGVSNAHLEALFPGSTSGLDRAIVEKVQLNERMVPEAVRWSSAAPRLMASNNWCVSGSRTASGAAMLANDPHLETNRLPNVWAEQSFRWPGGHAILVTIPGVPAPLVGRNEHVSWGATYTFMDAIDSWVEHCRDGKFRRGEGWVDFDRRVETIKRKKSESITETFWENQHGVLDGDPSGEGYLLATRWSGSFGGAQSINSLLRMWNAKTVPEGMIAYAQVESSFNWIFADTAGDIGYQMSGLMPMRPDGWNGFAPRPGWDERFDWRGFVVPSLLPRVHNPDSGMVVTANQDLNHLGEAEPINAPMGDYRARRIEQLLSERNDHDVDSFRAIQLDTYSIQAAEFMEILGPLLGAGPVADALRNWDCRYETDSVGATAFELFYAALLVEMFGPGCGAPVIEHLRDATGIFVDFYQNFDRVLVAESSPWLGDRRRDDVWRAALEKVSGETPVPWGQRNAITLDNMFFGGKLPRFLGFDPGPIQIRGGRATPHQGQMYYAGERLTSFTPSLRLVADMSEPVLHTALCGGPSDRRFSKHYKSGVQGWLDGALKVRKPPA